MIKSFANSDTEDLFLDQRVARFVNIESVARRKLQSLDSAARIDDLRVHSGNRLELLKGRRAGQYSIRVNDQWRICFVWKDDNPHDVQIVDCHDGP